MRLQYTLKDFDLLVAKVKHLRKKQDELKKEEDTAREAITDLLVEKGLDRLTTSQGFTVYIENTLSESLVDFYPGETLDSVRKWCCENNLCSINHQKFRKAVMSGDGPPFPTPHTKPYAFFTSVTNINTQPLDINKEIERAYMTAKKDRLPHMQLLRDAGLSYQKIADIYNMSKTQVRRDLNKKQTVKPKSIYSADI